MTTRLIACAAPLVASATSLGSIYVDLTFVGGVITDVSMVGASMTDPAHVTISYDLTVRNVGLDPIDLDGPTDGSGDDVAIQSLLSNTDDATGMLFASGGSNFGIDPGILNPGEDFIYSFTSNTLNLPDPTDLGAFQWLVFDIFNVRDEVVTDNNRLILFIPTPGAAALAGIGSLALIGRRRA